MEKEVLINCEELSFSYTEEGETPLSSEEVPALRDINFEVRRGEYIAVLGHNGSGKSTLAKLMNLILIPTSGKIFINGKDVSSPDLSDDEVYEIRKKVGMVFQNPDNQLVATVVEEDVAFGPENLGLPREEIGKRVVEALETVGMLEYKKHAPHKLSGGQKQRVAIAGIVAMRPELIIFDESTAMLDPRGRADVVEIMERLNREEGITVINITHYMDEAIRADRVVVINDGRIIRDGRPKEVFSSLDALHSLGLEAPQGTEALFMLKKDGADILTDALTEEECAEVIRAYLEEGTK